MRLIRMIRDWFEDEEGKKKFLEIWQTKHKREFDGQKDALDEYCCERAWDQYQSQVEIDTLKNRVENLESAINLVLEKYPVNQG